MAAFNKFNQFSEDLAKAVHNLATHTLKILLTNTAPVATNSVKADIVANELAAGNGYAAGGATATVVSCVQTAGVLKLVLSDVQWTSSTGNMGPFRYAVLYNDTPTSPADPLIGWYDRGSSLTLDGTNGDTFTLDFDAGTGVLTITVT